MKENISQKFLVADLAGKVINVYSFCLYIDKDKQKIFNR